MEPLQKKPESVESTKPDVYDIDAYGEWVLSIRDETYKTVLAADSALNIRLIAMLSFSSNSTSQVDFTVEHDGTILHYGDSFYQASKKYWKFLRGRFA